MRIPKKLIIKGKEWITKKVKSLKDESNEGAYGLTSVDDRVIEFDTKIAEFDKEWVFWHEYMHARLHECGVTGNTGGLSDLAEEIICDDFADFMTNEINWKWKRKKK